MQTEINLINKFLPLGQKAKKYLPFFVGLNYLHLLISNLHYELPNNIPVSKFMFDLHLKVV